MRLIRITTNNLTYLEQFYHKWPELRNQTYITQYQRLVNDCFGWADYWTYAFGKLGYEVWEPVGNAEPMQKAWARENSVNYNEANWLTDIVAAQVLHFQPDIVFVNDYSTYKAEFFQHLRDQCPSIRLVIGWCGAPYRDGRVFKEYDLVLSNIPSLVAHFQKNGLCSEYMLHAFEPRILEKLDLTSGTPTPFSFIGSVVKAKDFHNQREQLLKHLLQKTDIQIWANIKKPTQKEKKKLSLKRQIYDFVQRVKTVPFGNSLITKLPKLHRYASMEHPPDLSHYVDPEIANHSQSPLFGLSMFQKLCESYVTLNTHIDIAGSFASNMRLYEATGVGTCLLTDWMPNLSQIFEPDVEVVTYRSIEELIEKVIYLLNHKEECHKIAKAGQQKTLKDHTFDLRAQQLNELIRGLIA